MIRSPAMLSALALAAASTLALAQQAERQAPARGPGFALSLEAAQAALAACAADGVKEAVSVVDSAGVSRLMLAADGAANIEIEISQKKAATAVALKAATSMIAEKMEMDQAFKAKIEADKTLFPRPGGLPLVVLSATRLAEAAAYPLVVCIAIGAIAGILAWLAFYRA